LSATLSPAAARDDAATKAAAAAPAGARPGRALSANARRGLVRGTIRFTRDALMFSRDVREGMDLYLVRQRARRSPTLGAGASSRRPAAPPPPVEVPGALTAIDVNNERVKDDR